MPICQLDEMLGVTCVFSSHAVLARENSRFRVADGILTFAGIGDYPNCGKPEEWFS